MLTLGAAVHRLEVPGADGGARNVVLGHAYAADRLDSTAYIGGTIGRYANRIARGRFPLDGREVVVGTHDRGNSLHGGPDGFDRRLWEVIDHSSDALTMSLVSADGDQGFPGTVSASVRYTVDGEVVRGRDVGDHRRSDGRQPHQPRLLQPRRRGQRHRGRPGPDGAAEEYTPVDGTGIPLGAHAPVAGTPSTSASPRPIGPALRRDHPQLLDARGIDHNYVIRGSGLRTHATLHSPATGIDLEVRSDQPGLQVYTGNFLDGTNPSTRGGRYRQGDGIALEPQLFPDTPNRSDWPSAEVRPGTSTGRCWSGSCRSD